MVSITTPRIDGLKPVYDPGHGGHFHRRGAAIVLHNFCYRLAVVQQRMGLALVIPDALIEIKPEKMIDCGGHISGRIAPRDRVSAMLV